MTGDDRGIVDQSGLRVREATVAAGVWLTYVVCVTAAVYLACTWDRPHRPFIAVLFGGGLLAAGIVSALPAERIVRSRFREAFFFGWSTLDLALITLGALADGGTGSPLALIFFVPVVFSAMSYPLGSVIAVGGLTVTGYLSLALSAGGASWGYQALFAMMLACTGAMSAWLAGSQERQRQALMAVSRADALTGCLNRRGFEERAIAEIAAAGRSARQGAVLLLDVDHFKQVNDRYGHATGDELLRWVVATLRDCVRARDAIGRLGGDEFAVLLTEIEPGHAVSSAARISTALGARAPCSVGMATFPMDGSDLEELMRHADERLYASRHGRPEPGRASANERLSWAATLAHVVDMRMDGEHEHSRAVADYAVSIAEMLGWEQEMLGRLRIAAMLHDVGKISVPDTILCKPGPLTAAELELVKSHSCAGAELVARVEGLEMTVPWIRHAHERFDGSGYPDGLSGQDIPLASRIMFVADAFDAITSIRPYRGTRTVADACEELRRHAGSQFDPECVEALVARLQLEGLVGRSPSAAA